MKHSRNSLEGRPVFVVDGARTPFLKARGKPGPFLASDLAVSAGRPLLARQPFTPEDLDEVIFGCIMPTPDEVNIGRVIALRLGCGKQVPAWTVQRNCGSGMQALDCAAFDISSGRADLVLAGGTEAMSHAPVLFGPTMVAWLGEWAGAKGTLNKLKVLSKFRPAHLAPVIGILRGLTDPVVGLSMGQTAEILAYRFNISREQMDDYAMQSHHRLALAQQERRLGEVEVIYDWNGKVYDADEGVRADTTMASLAKLKPAFDRGVGKVTAGNSAQITDGAACLILASEDALKKHNLTPLGRIVDSDWAGLDPSQMGLGPVHAATPILQRHKLECGAIDYWEINEAFATQVLACLAAWKDADYCRSELGLSAAFGEIDRSRLNVDGGGISLGHPVGTSGARIVLHLLRVLEQKNAKRGVAALCIGGGQGGAMLVERV
jgi:acetyl-CoA C-acetyltransferase